MASYFLLEPEVAGELGPDTESDTKTYPPRVSRLHYEFTGWLGDDILESFPCYSISERCADALICGGFSGYELDKANVTASATFRELYGDRPLPRFFWLKISGRAGVDDFWLAPDHRLAVSAAVLAVLRSFHLKHCDLEEIDD
jgi:hypothetical protein